MDIYERFGLTTTPEIDELYHYTSLDGLLGILKENALWATDIDYLNDSTELSYGLNLAKKELEIRHKQSTHEEERDKIECLYNEIDNHVILNTAVSCLTEENDLLSQWRAYGEKGNGCSIGFNSSYLKTLADSKNYALVKVEYDLPKQKNIISILIDEHLRENFNTKQLGFLGKRQQDDGAEIEVILFHLVGGDFIKNLYAISPCLKDPSFHEEKEWRIISKIPFKKDEFRISKNMLIPYMKLELNRKEDYLKSITIGPTPHMNLAVRAIEKLIGKYSIGSFIVKENTVTPDLDKKVKILKSKIPYREW